MNIFTNLELLLSQEMESIKGGTGSEVCLCIEAAAQMCPDYCTCATAAAQTSSVCRCTSGANQPALIDDPKYCTTAIN